MAGASDPRVGAVEARTGGTLYVPEGANLKSPTGLVNEGTDVMGMRVILAPIKGLTSKKIMLSGSGQQRSFRFQMPPTESFARGMSYSHTDYDTLRLGTHSQPGGPGLQSVSFSTLFVDHDPSYAVWPNTQKFAETDSSSGFNTLRDEYWNVLNMTEQLEEIMNSGTPVRLYAGQPTLWQGGGGESGWDVNMPVTLRGLNVEERAGELDARYVDVEFVEYRELRLQRRRMGKATGAAGRSSAKRPAVVEIYPDGRAYDTSTEKKIATVGKATLMTLGKYYFGDTSGGGKQIRAANSILKSQPLTGALGPLARHYNGRPFRLRIPEGPATLKDENSYLDPNNPDVAAIIPEEAL